jgi:hypothetical protein
MSKWVGDSPLRLYTNVYTRLIVISVKYQHFFKAFKERSFIFAGLKAIGLFDENNLAIIKINPLQDVRMDILLYLPVF